MEGQNDIRRKYLIETDELLHMIESKEPVKIVNATWYMPNNPVNAWEEHLSKRITENTVFFDHNEICDKTSPLPHTMPSQQTFVDNMKKLNVTKDGPVVVYDNMGIFSVARAAWMMRYFGASNVRVLDGGLKKWLAEEKPTAEGPQTKHHAPEGTQQDGDFSFAPVNPSHCILDIKEMHAAAKLLYHGNQGDLQIVDARGAVRFEGKQPEPRPGLRSGHIKNSINVPFNMLLTENGTFKSENEMVQVFQEAGVNLNPGEPIINSCGSGVTACVVDLGLKLSGLNPEMSRVYDGSWTEYGGVPEPNFDE